MGVWLRYFALVLCACAVCTGASAAGDPPDSFNAYVLKAVDELTARQAQSGYDIKKAYSKAVPYADGALRPTQIPFTMCVAAVAEAIVVAINRYVAETGDKMPYSYFPLAGWNSMRPQDIRAHIWVDPRLGSSGTADALVTFAAGQRIPFSQLTPGSFINLNRTTKTGHAVIFLAFIDKKGNEVANYDQSVAGFKYFSANGSGLFPNGGFYNRYAFFNTPNGTPYCPTLPGKKTDCHIIFSQGQSLLNTGYMLMPSKWDAAQRDKNIDAINHKLYNLAQSRGPTFLNIAPVLDFDTFVQELQSKDTMVLNPIFYQSE